MSTRNDLYWFSFTVNTRHLDEYLELLLSEALDLHKDEHYFISQNEELTTIIFDSTNDDMNETESKLSSLLLSLEIPYEYEGHADNNEIETDSFNGKMLLSKDERHIGDTVDVEFAATAILNQNKAAIDRILTSYQLVQSHKQALSNAEVDAFQALVNFMTLPADTFNPTRYEQIFFSLIQHVKGFNQSIPGMGGDFGLFLSEFLTEPKGESLLNVIAKDSSIKIQKKRAIAEQIVGLPDDKVFPAIASKARRFLELTEDSALEDNASTGLKL